MGHIQYLGNVCRLHVVLHYLRNKGLCISFIKQCTSAAFDLAFLLILTERLPFLYWSLWNQRLLHILNLPQQVNFIAVWLIIPHLHLKQGDGISFHFLIIYWLNNALLTIFHSANGKLSSLGSIHLLWYVPCILPFEPLH